MKRKLKIVLSFLAIVAILTSCSGIQLDTEYSLVFSELVIQLDTPEKLVTYMRDNFTEVWHEGHISYSPEVFFSIKEGGCKELATFGSYVLDQHGYEVKIMCIKLSGELIGQHALTYFRDKNDKLKYITNNMCNIEIIEVESVEKILASETERLCCEITKYGFVAAGSTYVWVDGL
jgi:hypothetical protein